MHSVKAAKTQKKVKATKTTKKPIKAIAKRKIATKRTPITPQTTTVASTLNAPVSTTKRTIITSISSQQPQQQPQQQQQLQQQNNNFFQKLTSFPQLKNQIFTLSLRNFNAGGRQRLRGTVKWFDPAKGFGFVTDPNGSDLFVHFTAINSNGYRVLTEGQIIEFSIGSTAKGPAAVDVVVTSQAEDVANV